MTETTDGAPTQAAGESTTSTAATQPEPSFTDMVDLAYKDAIGDGTTAPAAEQKQVTTATTDEDEEDDAPPADAPADGKQTEGAEAWKLDPEVEKALPAEVKTRWDNHVKGLVKREERVKGQEQRLNVFDSYMGAFENAEHAAPALKQLAAEVAKLHGKTLEQMLGLTPSATNPAATTTRPTSDWRALGFASQAEFDAAPDWQKNGYESPGEWRLHQQNEELRAQIQKLSEGLTGIDADRKAAAEKAQREQQIQAVTQPTIKKLATDHNGWKVSPEMVSQAIAAFPTLEPAAAVEAKFPRELARHYAASATKSGPKIDDMNRGGERTGLRPPPDDDTPLDKLVDFVYTNLGN